CSKQQIANSKQISKGSVCSKQHACMHGSSTIIKKSFAKRASVGALPRLKGHRSPAPLTFFGNYPPIPNTY
ncbi:hypothetical protein ACN38_g12299, partial [Penicillium nordicum]